MGYLHLLEPKSKNITTYLNIPTQGQRSRLPEQFKNSQIKNRRAVHRHQKKSSLYKLTCNTCKMAYIGQASRHLRQSYHEHIRYKRYNNLQSAYAKHIPNQRHDCGPIDNKMSQLKRINNNSMLLTYEQLYILTLQQHKPLISLNFFCVHYSVLFMTNFGQPGPPKVTHIIHKIL